MSNAVRYIPATIWIFLLIYVLTRHIKVYKLYDSQLKVVRQIEDAGGIEDGSTLVAVNQRVRYVIRIVLAVFGFLIGIGGFYGVYNPGFGQSVAFGLSVLVYFYGSEAATGYLTIRDERVIQKILEIDQSSAQDSMDRNTEAMDRNTQAMDRAEAGQRDRADRSDDRSDRADDRADRAEILAGNTQAVDDNTAAVQRNTEARADE